MNKAWTIDQSASEVKQVSTKHKLPETNGNAHEILMYTAQVIVFIMFYVSKYLKDRCKSFLKPISGRSSPSCSQSYPQALCVQNGASNLPVCRSAFLPVWLPVFGRRPRVFRRRAARSDLPFDWRLRQRRARVPGSRAGATIALRRPAAAYPLLTIRSFSEIRPDAKVPAVITNIALPLAATPPCVAVVPSACIVRS